MKTITLILSAAFLIIAAVMISLLRSGGALKPAGVIKPAEIGPDVASIGKQIAVRLFPDFQESQIVIWRIEGGAEELAQIARVAFVDYRSPIKHSLQDLRTPGQACPENCWYIQDLEKPLPAELEQRTKSIPTAEVFVQYFHRDQKVPEACDAEKLLDIECMKYVSVREVRRKIKKPAPYFFMQRYQKSQFYLFIEKPA